MEVASRADLLRGHVTNVNYSLRSRRSVELALVYYKAGSQLSGCAVTAPPAGTFAKKDLCRAVSRNVATISCSKIPVREILPVSISMLTTAAVKQLATRCCTQSRLRFLYCNAIWHFGTRTHSVRVTFVSSKAIASPPVAFAASTAMYYRHDSNSFCMNSAMTPIRFLTDSKTGAKDVDSMLYTQHKTSNCSGTNIESTDDRRPQKEKQVINRENLLTIPNLLTVARLAATPVIGYLITTERWHESLGLVCVVIHFCFVLL